MHSQYTKAILAVYSCLIFNFNPILSADNIDFVEKEELFSKLNNKAGCNQHKKCRAKCGTKPFPSNTGFITPDPIIHSSQVWNFVSEPHLHPMKITVNKYNSDISPGLIFLAPYGFSEESMVGQPGVLILDNAGIPFWFRPLSSPNLMNTDFRKQKLFGNSVLTFWQGTLATPPAYTNVPAGSSEPGSCYYILDNTYAVIKTVKAKKGFTSDIHEFLLTPRNTALLLSTKSVPMDLTPHGGPKDGFIQDFAIQEIDLKTNKLVFFWNALDHIPLTDSYSNAASSITSGNIWDAYHLNSIGLTDCVDDILVSGRNTWTIYKISKPKGNIVWRLGGKQTDFQLENGAEFSWQHDARFLPNNLISMFDDNSDGSSVPGPSSHGLILKLNFQNMTASLDRSYFHDPNVTVASQGNLQSLTNGNKFVGWGQSQYYSEFRGEGNTESDPGLNLLYDAQMPSPNYTYRAYREKWVGKPYYPPSIAAQSSIGLTNVYASWNGSTETVQWQVWAGTKPKNLCLAATTVKTGFETIIPVCNPGPYYRVKALNANGNVIGKSKTIRVGNYFKEVCFVSN